MYVRLFKPVAVDGCVRKPSLASPHLMMLGRTGLQGVITVTEISKSRNNIPVRSLVSILTVGQKIEGRYLLLLIQSLIDECSDNSQLGESFSEFSDTRGTGNQIQE